MSNVIKIKRKPRPLRKTYSPTAPHYHQPRLMDHWGCEFFGEAETTTGDVWWYEDRQDDGSVRRVPLLPMAPEAVKNNP